MASQRYLADYRVGYHWVSKNRCQNIFTVDIDLILLEFPGNEDMHNILDEFEFRPDRTTDYVVSCFESLKMTL